ncbi:LysR family transcriptional regulator [Aminobacter sp. MET-1]|uniref:LysR family transcriptional regulator n=1 Tax=Aminobacter sp. MET-1 TaxID=2951085 RepID=UPI0022699BB8|nr:LysR family transcriptional regulator [Aminobacter sp. MET-1]MCX8570764.1 LysR family transcriptional regulator [Aminobacter sp. MET-1]
MKASINELEAVTAIARLGGFRPAARELSVSSSALSHAVSALEARLNVRLFNRTTRSVVLTAAGVAFVADIGPALAAIERAVEQAQETQARPTGVLRLNTSLGAARMLLEPLLLEYLRRYPEMSLELATEGALIDVIGEGFDGGFRLAEAVPPDMIAIPVTRQERMIVVGSPAYFQRRPAPQHPHDLVSHDCIRARMASGRVYRWEFARRGESMEVDVPGRLVLDESSLIHQATLAGAGLAFLWEWLVRDDIAAGRLVRALDDWTPPYDGVCLYYPGRRHVPTKLRAMIDLARELYRADGVGRDSTLHGATPTA